MNDCASLSALFFIARLVQSEHATATKIRKMNAQTMILRFGVSQSSLDENMTQRSVTLLAAYETGGYL